MFLQDQDSLRSMDLQMAGWKAHRDQEYKVLRAKAPIAARFEDCLQLLGRLSATLTASLPESEQIALLAEDCETKFKIWGHDAGADSRALDHTLRDSSRLGEATVQLLDDLREILIHGVEEIPQRYALASDTPWAPEKVQLQDDLDSDLDPDKYLDDAVELISCLCDLLPELRRPARDKFSAAIVEDKATVDLEVALEMFPKAPEFLKERLATANSMRRQRLRALGASTIGASADHALGKFHLATQEASWPNLYLRYTREFFRHRRSKRANSEAGISTIASTAMDTIFSNGRFPSVLGTSVAETQDSPASHLHVPEPPVKLNPGVSFTCPYCLFELPFDLQDMTEQTWVEHVFLDLEPYVCTFENCLHAHKTFGRREEWFHHETCEHRLQKVWVCHSPLCTKEFSSEVLFQDHLLASHGDLFQGSDLSAVLDTFKSVSPLMMRTYLCTLCQSSYRDASKLKEHVAIHLEQFALTALYEEEESDDEASDDGGNEAEGSDQPGELRLGQFVAEQASLYERARSGFREVQHPQQNRLAWENLHNPDLPPRKGKGKAGWEERMNIFLEDNQVPQHYSSEAARSDDIISFNRPPRYAEFVGRKEALDSLHEVLSKPGQVYVVSGRGGIGKTATAVEYSYQFQSEYSAIFWIEAETAGGCADKYAMIASSVGLANNAEHGQAGLVSLAREYLTKSERRWLLIFDNVEDWNDIDRYIPKNMPRTCGSVLITARETSSWPQNSKNYSHVTLDIMPLEESTCLLLRSMHLSAEPDWTKHQDYALAAEASRLVGQLPLAISMVAGYVRVSCCTLDEFLETWEEREEMSKKQQKSRSVSQGIIDASIDALWDIGIGELSYKARSLLDIFSFLDPEAIQKELLMGDHTEEALGFLNSAETIRYKRMIDQLSGRKLITLKTQDDGSEIYSIHRLLQAKILADMDSNKIGDAFNHKYGETFQNALSLIRKKYPPASSIQIPEPAKWPECEKYMLHVSSLYRIYRDYRHISRIKPSLELAQLFYNAGFHVWERQSTAYDGLSFLKCAEEILDEIQFDADGKLRADIHSIAGIYYTGAGSAFRNESVKREKAAFRIRELIYNSRPDRESDVLLRNAASDLALCLLNKNEFEEAGKLIEGCIKQYCVWGTEDEIPFEYAKYYNCNAFIQMRRANYPEAIKSLEKCVHLAAKHSTKTWQYWQYQFSLACILHQSGESQKALDVHLETLNGRLDLFGNHDQSTIFSTYAVGAMYHHVKALSTATDYMVECIESAKNSKFPEEALGRAQYHLMKILREQGIEQEEADRLETDALKTLDKYSQYTSEFLKGVDDPMTLFDDLQSIFDGRFTGQQLLRYMQSVVE